jgi:hypothetical protein
MKLLLLLTAFVGLGWSQIDDNQRTAGLLNGRFWTATLSTHQRIAFVMGYSEAWHGLHGPKNDPDGFPKNVTYSDLVTGLNQLYSAPENLIIPIYTAMHLWTNKVEGEDPVEWAKDVALAIRLWRLASDPK